MRITVVAIIFVLIGAIPVEAEELAAEEEFSYLSLLKIGRSDIHGRGVLANQDIKKGRSIGLLWFDFFHTSNECKMLSTECGIQRQGYISNGGTILLEKTTLSAAKEKCSKWDECQGITFQDPLNICIIDSNSSSANTCRAEGMLSIEYKNHTLFGTASDWFTFLKPIPRPAMFPLVCNSAL